MCSLYARGSTSEQGVQLHPRFWLCIPSLARCNKNIAMNNITSLLSIETLQNHKFACTVDFDKI